MATVQMAALVEAATRGAAAGGGSRQVVAAATAAAMRTVLSESGTQAFETGFDVLVRDRLQAIAPALVAQFAESKLLGHSVHSSKGLVDEEVQLRANVAKHSAFDTGEFVTDMPVADLRRRQRGGRRGRNIGVTLTQPDDGAQKPTRTKIDELEARLAFVEAKVASLEIADSHTDELHTWIADAEVHSRDFCPEQVNA